MDKARLWERLPWKLGLLFCALSIALPWRYFDGWSTMSGGLDWGLFQFYAELHRQTILEYGQFPFWNPYFCGGTVQFANPQAILISPWTVPSLLFGTQPGLRIHVVGFVFISLCSMFAWARDRRLDPVAAAGSALAYGLSGFVAARIAWGYESYFSFAYLPLVMMAYEHARTRLASSVALGALMALMFYEGGAYPLPMTSMVLALRLLWDIVQQPRRAPRLIAGLALAASIAVGLAAPKLLPVLSYLLEYKRTIHKRDFMNLTQVLMMFVGRNTDKKELGYVFNRYEYYNYLGPIVVAAIGWGAWRLRRERLYRELLALMAMVALLMIGRHGDWSPYTMLSKLPLLSGMRNPSRYTVFVGLFAALAFGYALVQLGHWLDWRRPGWGRWIAPLLITLFAVDAFFLSQGFWRHNTFSKPVPPRQHKAFVWRRGGGTDQYRRLLANEGSINCYEGIHIPASPDLRPDDTRFVWTASPQMGTARLVSFSPNRFVARAHMSTAGRVLFAQNRLRGWQLVAPASGSLVEEGRTLAVDLPPGDHEIVVRYRPPLLLPGLLLCLLTLLGLALAWVLSFILSRRPSPKGRLAA